jgi:two-component system LytT family sensor kinase
MGRNREFGYVKRLLRYAAVALVVTTVMTLFTSLQIYMQMVMNGEFGTWTSSFAWNAVIWYAWIPLIPFAIVSCRRYPVEGARRGENIFMQAVLVIGFIVLHALLAATVMSLDSQRFYNMPVDPRLGADRLLTTNAHWGLMLYACVFAFVHMTIYFERAQAELLAREALRTEAATAQLSALKRHMQPHFLFNSLNALVSMQSEGSAEQRFTVRLADMLRILLRNADHATASLAEEIALVDAYIEIERTRLGARLHTRVSVADNLLDCRLPSFILQPLVENAIRHGVSRTLESGEIVLSAQRVGDEIRIEISNSCPADDEGAEAGSRMTLPNCRRRLALMYGAAARFDAGFVDGNHFRASIILNDAPREALLPA